MENNGISVLNAPSKKLDTATVVVLGPGRSGTSLVANVIAQSGIYMGEYDSPTAEDLDMAKALEVQGSGAVASLVGKRNEKHDVWGWKRPQTINLIDGIHSTLRNPIYVCVYRDALAIARRNEISIGRDVSVGMRSALRSYLKMNEFIFSVDSPLLLLSFEKVQKSPASVVDALASMLQKKYYLPENFMEALESKKSQYLQVSKLP